jgi:anti-sigma factor RsiW
VVISEVLRMILQAATPVDSWTSGIPVIAAIIAAGAAIAVAIISVWSQRNARKSDELARRTQRSTEFHRKQLDELYGEMFLLRSTSRRLWTRLHDDASFRLIDNIAAIKGEPSDRRRRIVEQILAINARLASLIETRASLLTGLPPPESFMAFLDHQRALATLWEMGVNVEQDGREPSFPRDLDADIKQAIDSIQSRLRELDA